MDCFVYVGIYSLFSVKFVLNFTCCFLSHFLVFMIFIGLYLSCFEYHIGHSLFASFLSLGLSCLFETHL